MKDKTQLIYLARLNTPQKIHRTEIYTAQTNAILIRQFYMVCNFSDAHTLPSLGLHP